MFIPKSLLSEIDNIEKDIVDNLISRYVRDEITANTLSGLMYKTHMMYSQALEVISCFVEVRDGLKQIENKTLN